MMGLLDGLLGNVLGGVLGGNQQGSNPLLQAVLGMLGNQSAENTGGSGGLGGLGSLVQQFQNNGLGEVIQSWISTGKNLPISAEQLQQVLGGEQLQQLAQAGGVHPNEIGSTLSELLPQVVDKLTPDGQIPEGGLGDAMGMLQKLLNR